MADLSKLSDKELDAMIAQHQGQAPASDLSHLSDDELDKMISQAGGPPMPKADRYSQADTAIMHGLQGASAGFLDELSGAGEAAGRAVGVRGLGGKFSDVELAEPDFNFKQNYLEGRDRKRQLLADMQKEHPGTATAANVVGSVISPANKIAKGQRLISGAAGIGLVNALGSSDADNAKDLLIDSATGAVIGGALGYGADKAAKAVDKGVQKLGEKSKEGAKWLAARALGAERGTIKSLGADRVKAAGAQALDENVLSAFANTDDLIARNQAVRQKGGQMMEKAYGAIDDARASTFNPLEVAAKVDEQLSPTFRTAINKGETSQLENTLESILARGEKNIPLKEAQKLKQEIGSVAFPKGRRPIDPSPKQQMAMDAYDIVNKSIDEAAQKGAGYIEQSGLSDVLAKGKELYGGAKTSSKLLDNKLAREQGNRMVGLTDMIVGVPALGYGGMTGDWETSIGLMAGKKYLEKYGAQQAALVLNKMSQKLMTAPAMAEAAKKSPALFVSIAQKLEGRGGAAAAANDELKPDLKGKDKWVSDGFSKVIQHSPDLADNLDQVGAILKSERGRSLLIQASDMKPGSKGMVGVSAKLKNEFGKGS